MRLIGVLVLLLLCFGCGDREGDAVGSGGQAGHTQSYFVDKLTNDGCFARMLNIENCSIVEVRFTGDCGCDDSPGRNSPSAAMGEAVVAHLSGTECDIDGAPSCAEACLCVLRPASTAELLDACLNDETVPTDASGWCYINPESSTGDPALIPHCDSERGIRFLGPSEPAADALLEVACGSR